jgi:hypothetical protein
MNAGIADDFDSAKCAVKRAGFADGIVGFAQSVDAELIFATAQRFEAFAHIRGQMERIAHDGKWNILLMQHSEDIPKAWMQNGVTTGDVKIWQAFHALTHFPTSVNHRHAALPTHFDEFGMAFAENVAMLATLVANIGYVPLKSKIFHLVRTN